MVKIKNVSPLGELYVPALNITVAAGAIAEVSDEAGASLLEQPENWAAVTKSAAPIPAPDSPAPANA